MEFKLENGVLDLGTVGRDAKGRGVSWLKWLLHPVTVFVLLQVVWITVTLLWVIWFVGEVDEITKLARSFGSQHFDTRYAIVIMVIGCVLLGMLLAGTVVLFVFVQRQAQHISQHKRFLSSVTHELRSPLASLRLHVETMQARKLDSTTLQQITYMAIDDIDRLSRFVNQILVSARLDSGIDGLDDSTELVDMREFIAEAVNGLKWIDGRLHHRIDIDCQVGIKVRIAKSIVVLILNNLVENAVKYSPRDSKVLIRVTTVATGIVISVHDRGFGIAERDRKKVFEMFYRAKIAEKKAISGTGLGLFIVKSLARCLGGSISVAQRADGQGSVFEVFLPIKSGRNRL